MYNEAGVQTTSFFFGNPGDFPILGDWDCDGVETPGMYRQSDGYVYLKNSNTQGLADIFFFFGNPGDLPIAGDFNGDGCGTVSIYRPSNQTFYIINELGENDGGLGAAESSYVFGNPGDKPFVGDFDGDGVETVGLHRESTGFVYFRNSHTQGNADNDFFFGNPGDRFIAGDWTADGVFTPALFRPSNTTMYFRYTNTQGNADAQFVPSPVGSAWLPVSGILSSDKPSTSTTSTSTTSTTSTSTTSTTSTSTTSTTSGCIVDLPQIASWEILGGDSYSVGDVITIRFEVLAGSAMPRHISFDMRDPINGPERRNLYRNLIQDERNLQGDFIGEGVMDLQMEADATMLPGSWTADSVIVWDVDSRGAEYRSDGAINKIPDGACGPTSHVLNTSGLDFTVLGAP
ncbi:hypothetical protein ACFLQ7_00555 [Actinomycetota bacterium]